MSEYLGGGGLTPPNLDTMFGARPGSLFTNPVLARIRDDASSDRYIRDPVVSRFVTQSVDKVHDFLGVGIVFRSSTGVIRQVRLPARPGDLTLFVLFGPSPSGTPAAPPPGASDTLRH